MIRIGELFNSATFIPSFCVHVFVWVKVVAVAARFRLSLAARRKVIALLKLSSSISNLA